MMIGLYQTGINVGQLIGASIDQGTYMFENRFSYRIPLITQMVFPAIIATGIWFLPETPRKFSPLSLLILSLKYCFRMVALRRQG